jgi:RHS repeat-associated protein
MVRANPFRFSTKYQDDETDLLYYGYRYFNGSTGRWLSRDPIEETGGLNLYEFALNSPVERVDKNGLTTYDFDKNTYYRSIDFQPGDIVIFPGGSKVVVQPGGQDAIAKYKCLLSKLSFNYSSPSFPVYWANFIKGGTAWTLDYGIPSKRPTFFDRQRMDPPTTINAELNSVTVWHEIKGHNIDGAADGAAFDAKYEAPVYAAIKNAKLVLECMWCEPKDGSRHYMVPNRFFRYMCECGINAPPARNQ